MNKQKPLHRGNSHEAGFTLVELIVVISTSALFIGLILGFGMNYWQNVALMQSDNDTFISRLNAQDYIREIIGTSDGLINQNSIADANTGAPDPVAGSNYWVTTHAVPQTITLSGTNSIPILYFRRLSFSTSGTVIMNGSTPYDDEYVMYANPVTRQILVRTLANPSAPNNRAKTTCPPSIATTACPADKVMLSNVASVTATYYSRSGNTINYQSIVDPNTGNYIGPDFTSVEALQYSFHITAKPLFQHTNATVNDTIVRIALRNT